MEDVVYDLLRADRDGMWGLYLDDVQCSLYLFSAFDTSNYLRWCSIYIKDMHRLPETAQYAYEHFSSGNLSSKCSDGVIGHPKQKQYIAQ